MFMTSSFYCIGINYKNKTTLPLIELNILMQEGSDLMKPFVRGDIEFHLLKELYNRYQADRSGLTTQQAYKVLVETFEITKEQLNMTVKSGKESLWDNKVRQAKRELTNHNLVSTPKRGYWMITSKGIEKFETMKEPAN
jgi:restriction endonuclease Mrr